MKHYNELTTHGKLRRLRNLAVLGLSHYALKDPKVIYHGFDTNLLFQVTTADGERFMLRLAYPGWRTYKDLLSEALWVNALARDTTVPVPTVKPARSGDLVLSISVPDIPNIWHMTMIRWVPGRLLGHYLTACNLFKMGELFSELHHHGADWIPPEAFTTRRFEHWLSRGEEKLNIDNNQNPVKVTLFVQNMGVPAQHQKLLERMHQHVEKAYATIDRSDLRVIHCDLWHDNIKLHCGILYPFDFEDTVWGFRAHDIAMAMLDLLETVGEEKYPELLSAFRYGYESQMSWPEDPIEPFQIGRLLWKINWVSRFDPQHLLSMIEEHIPLFEHYEETGCIKRPPVE